MLLQNYFILAEINVYHYFFFFYQLFIIDCTIDDDYLTLEGTVLFQILKGFSWSMKQQIFLTIIFNEAF